MEFSSEEGDSGNEFAFIETEVPVIAEESRISRITDKKRLPWWALAIKILSPTVVTVLLFLGYRHFYMQQQNAAPLPQVQKVARAETPSPSSEERENETSLPEVGHAEPNGKYGRDNDRDTAEQAPLAEQPSDPIVAELELPSGRKISSRLLSPTEKTEIALLQIRDTEHYYHKDDNGCICAVCQYDRKDGKIDGLLLRTHTDGTISSLAHFSKSKRDGPLYCWNQHGQICYYCDWVNGNKQGITCLFVEEKPVLVQEWKANELVCQYQVTPREENRLEIKEVITDDPSVEPHQDQIAQLEHDLDEADTTLRKKFSRDFRDMSKESRLRRSAQLVSGGLANIPEQDPDHQLQEQADETDFWQKATAGNLWSGKQRWLAPKTNLAK